MSRKILLIALGVMAGCLMTLAAGALGAEAKVAPVIAIVPMAKPIRPNFISYIVERATRTTERATAASRQSLSRRP